MIWAYKGQQIGQLDPHIYAISEDAYSEMTTLVPARSFLAILAVIFHVLMDYIGLSWSLK